MARVGTKKHPAVAHVQTPERAEEIIALCQANDVHCIVGIEPEQPEDISDVLRALNPPAPVIAAPTVGRNEPCPCGSGKKFKKCCESAPTPSGG
ncbi:MAG TPA: PBPRA1643 family SWIM/SEC-C metal-binding motif protein [Kofleriaceae bacterium]|nr:PBPRA1643 family SWIM/SEC-C metal-binding motif protein [Kofleriaceae bacterium]